MSSEETPLMFDEYHTEVGFKFTGSEDCYSYPEIQETKGEVIKEIHLNKGERETRYEFLQMPYKLPWGDYMRIYLKDNIFDDDLQKREFLKKFKDKFVICSMLSRVF